MIKPGTVCMIRGVPSNSPSSVANGRIVTVVKYMGDYKGFNDVHQFEPPVTIMGQEFDKAQKKWLHPLDPCEDDLSRETLERLDEQLQETFIKTVLEKI